MPTEEMQRRCEQIWEEAMRQPAKLVKTSLMRMGWKNYRLRMKRRAQAEAVSP